MPSVTIRNVPDAVHRVIRVMAAQHGSSIEAEMRDILESAVRPWAGFRLGSLLAGVGRKVNMTDEEFATLESVRDRTAAPSSRI